MTERSDDFVEIPIAAVGGLAGNDEADFAVFLPSESRNGPVLYRRAGADLADPDYGRMREHGVSHLCIRSEDLCKCEQVLESKLTAIIGHSAFTAPEKARLVHQVGTALARDLVQETEAPVDISRTTYVVDGVIAGVLNDPLLASHLLSMASHERTVASHMFIVSSLAIMLGNEALGSDNETLRSLGVAGMLHDLGKLAIAPEVLGKTTPLSPDELQMIEQHPIESIRRIGDDPLVTTEMRQMILQHHERVDGKGYPLGLRGHELALGSRLLAIVDSFHAMIGRRAYRSSMTPADATRVMNSQAGSQFDADLLQCWNQLFDRHWQPGTTLAQLTETSPQVGSRHEHRATAPQRAVHRQRHRRFQLRQAASVPCRYAGQLIDTEADDGTFEITLLDISRAGCRVHGSRPMYRGEVINLQLRIGQRITWIRGAVAWCRMQPAGGFQSGIRFLTRVDEGQLDEKVPVLEMTAAISRCAREIATVESRPNVVANESRTMPDEELSEVQTLDRLEQLAACTQISSEHERWVIAQTGASVPRIRARAVQVVARSDSRAARSALVDRLRDPEPTVREQAIDLVGARQIRDGFAQLQSLLDDPSPNIALRAAAALGQMGDRQGIQLVARLLRASGVEARLAAKALGRIVGHNFPANAEGIAAAQRYLATHDAEHAPGVEPLRTRKTPANSPKDAPRPRVSQAPSGDGRSPSTSARQTNRPTSRSGGRPARR